MQLLLIRSHSRKHQELEFKFTCEHCDYKTKLSGHLKRHMRVHEMEDGKIYQCPHCDYACNNSVSITTRCLIAPSNCSFDVGELAETCPEDQQASREVPLRVRLLRRRVDAIQEQSDEGISIAPETRSQHHEEDLKRRQRILSDVKKVNCKEINSISSGTLKRARKSCRKSVETSPSGDLMRFNNFDC